MTQSSNAPNGGSGRQHRGEKPKRISMHENVPVWYDCCSCEAEPHWLEVAQELGIDDCGHYEEMEATDCEGRSGR